ncbi:MAG: ArsR family transcriptional regulator [Oceanospirillaceae bacterium]|nr:ArsR family transcriptional regulator [Oceanospirillaceae bacterium]MBT11242.1 ArsR family transcriptional regulator [Oceanospirillaceae bacterium]|tara:strand:- start:93393 stop:94367 length:975 start_codon:yes stop_codon:yes gene_type:complete
MTESAPIATDQFARAAKAAGDNLRLSILKLLGQGSFGVMELCEVFGIKQSGMSHHLKVLSQAGLVTTRREGNSIFYRRPLISGRDAWSQWLKATYAAIDVTDALAQPEYQQGLTAVLAERSQACAEFFSRNAEAFKEQQDLIASYDQYGETLESLIAAYRGNKGYALEVGPGAGEFLPALSAQFKQVLALDISPQMLQQAAAVSDEQQLTNVTCRLGDTGVLVQDHSTRIDFAVANMVLHHVPTPKTIFNDVARLLKPGGTLLITDLCRHEQSWARESCGDLWLGFDPEDLSDWAQEAGLIDGQSQFLGLRNGFQIQFRLFHHE